MTSNSTPQKRPHSWLWLHVIGGWQIIRCRYCGKHAQYRPMGFATQIPEGECDV